MWYYRLIAVLTALDLIGKSAVEALPEKAFPRELPPGKPLMLLKRFHNEGLPLGFLAKRRSVAHRESGAVSLFRPAPEARP